MAEREPMHPVILVGTGPGNDEPRPLFGKRLLAVSAIGDRDDELPPIEGLSEAEAAVARLGLEVEWCYPLRVVEHPERLTAALANIGRYRAIAFTSHRGALTLSAALEHGKRDARALAGVSIACLAGRSAGLLRGQLHIEPDIVAEGGGRALAEALLAAGVGGPVLFPRAAEGREELPDALRAAGVEVDVVAAYETVVDVAAVEVIRASARRAPFDAVAFGSPRSARALLEAGLPLDGTLVGAIGKTTARALEERGLRVPVVASHPSYAALIEELGAALLRALG